MDWRFLKATTLNRLVKTVITILKLKAKTPHFLVSNYLTFAFKKMQ